MITRALVRPVSRPVSRPINGLPIWTPAALFAQGQAGAWYDPSDLSTLYQDAAGTTPVTSPGDPVGLMLDKSGNGNHASQVTDAARPIYQADGALHWLQFDGADDRLVIGNLPGAQAGVFVAAAVLAASGAKIVGSHSNSSDVEGTMGIDASGRIQAELNTASSGYSAAYVSTSGANASRVATLHYDGSRLEVAENDTRATLKKTGLTPNGAAPWALGAVNGMDTTSGFIDGRIYGALVVLDIVSSANADAARHHLASRSGVAL